MPVALVLLGAAAPGGPTRPEIVSLATDGRQGDGDCYGSGAVSGNGRFVAFQSLASNLVEGDRNGVGDVFVRDRLTETTTRVSVASDGTEGNGPSGVPCISANGRWVLFISGASNLVPGDQNGEADVFLHDRKTGETRRVSVAEDGTEGNGFSGAYGAGLSANGRFAVFTTRASNLVPGDDNGLDDVVLADLRNGRLTLVSRRRDGSPARGESRYPSLSPNGRFVAFASTAPGLVEGLHNRAFQVFVMDRKTRIIRCASVNAGGFLGTRISDLAVVSDDGNIVAFTSQATNFSIVDTNRRYDVCIHDFRSGTTTPISVIPGLENGLSESVNFSMSRDGKFVVFESDQYGDTREVLYAWDASTGTAQLLSRTPSGKPWNGASELSTTSLSPDGRWLSFLSVATDAAKGDRNGNQDIFLLDLGAR